jgi:hypothetical protein
MKFIKFDTLYPSQYLEKKISENRSSIKRMDFDKLTEWLIGLRLNFSDYYSYNLRLLGWETKEFFVLGKGCYLRKCGREYFGWHFPFFYAFYRFFGRFSQKTYMEAMIEKIVDVENPDVIFIREQSMISSLFWDKFRNRALVVSRMECAIPKYWSPMCFDVVYTNINTYRDFFKSNRVVTYSNYSGFDERVSDEIGKIDDFDFDVVFVGGLGSTVFLEKTVFMEQLLSMNNNHFRFAWWGYKEGSDFCSRFPLLEQAYQGISGGVEMFEIYRTAKIVLNDYGLLAGGQGMNQRIYEVLGIGGFLLTRNSSMFTNWEDSIATYDNADDCMQKIDFYLTNEEERNRIAKKGQDYVLTHYNYRHIMEQLSKELEYEHNRKFRT